MLSLTIQCVNQAESCEKGEAQQEATEKGVTEETQMRHQLYTTGERLQDLYIGPMQAVTRGSVHLVG